MSRKTLYAILAIGAIGTFLGHGAWALGAKDSFLELFRGSLDNVLGVTVSENGAKDWVRGIGAVDMMVTASMVLMLIGVLRGAGALYRLAHSWFAIGVWSWAILWGFATAASRLTAAGEFYPELWDLVERAPNFMLPAALLYMVMMHRREHPEAPLFAHHITEAPMRKEETV